MSESNSNNFEIIDTENIKSITLVVSKVKAKQLQLSLELYLEHIKDDTNDNLAVSFTLSGIKECIIQKV